jgi:hypothetical protein
VSTAEVGGMISGTEGIEDVAVYGVEIPGCDGKAGMMIMMRPFDMFQLRETKVCSRRCPCHIVQSWTLLVLYILGVSHADEANVKINFSARVFPTPMRESKVQWSSTIECGVRR